MKNIIVVTGTPGAGKTTVLAKAIDLMPTEVKILNYADIMIELGKDLGLGDDHDKIRKLPVEKQRDLQKKAGEKIASLAQGTLIVDTHCTVNTPKGYLPGLPEWVIKALDPRAIVLIEAKPEEIVSRRETDPTRKRDEEALEKIKIQQEINRAAAIAYASMCGATVKIINNSEGKVEEAAKELVKILEE